METLPNSERSPDFPEFAKEIAAMHAVDQQMREQSLTDDSWDESIDARHTERMKEIINQIGWPTVSRVGVAGAEQAWLLVQHADHDVEFQKRCLERMQAESASEVSRGTIALLTDRIRVNSGQPQIYGTQFEQVAGKHVPRPIEDIDQVDARRASMGLGTLEEGIASMYEKYGTPKQDGN